MSEELFVQCCAPTLAGLKTGSMFSAAFERKEDLTKEIRCLNQQLSPRGLCVLPLRYRNGKALIYVYRPKSLKRDMENGEAKRILCECGYEGLGCGACIRRLMQRMQGEGDFPHEVGLFLSYPPEDVRGFMENRAGGCKLCGYWKVYGDEEKARATFHQYRVCTESYCRMVRKGVSLTRLAAAI